MKKSKEYNDFIEKLYNYHYKYFFRTAYAILENKEDAEDAVTESFLIFYKYSERIYKLECPEIVPYCLSIIKRVSYKLKKKKSKLIFLEYSESLIDKNQLIEGYDKTVDKILENEDLYNLLSKLSKSEYKLLEYRIEHNLKFKEIAEILNISEETAKKRYQRLIKKLCQEQGRY